MVNVNVTYVRTFCCTKSAKFVEDTNMFAE